MRRNILILAAAIAFCAAIMNTGATAAYGRQTLGQRSFSQRLRPQCLQARSPAASLRAEP